MRWNKGVRWIPGVAGVVLIAALSGCNRDDTKVYQVPPDDSQPAQPTQPASDANTQAPPQGMDTSADAQQPLPAIKYKLPDGWKEQPPSEMRVASFTATAVKGKAADVAVIPMPIVGRDLELVNMWRSQVQLPPTTDPDAAKKAEPVDVGAEQGRLFEFVGTQPGTETTSQRMMVVVLTRGAMSWFFKITGDDTVVTAEKPKFLQFLKSVSFEEQAPAPMASAPAAPDNSVDVSSIWTVPAGWKQVPPAQFLMAEFSISGEKGAKAEVNVAAMGGEGGGLLANVNRWRGQLGLDPVAESELPKFTKALDVPGGGATLVDLSGKDVKSGEAISLLGAIILQNGQTWFYKLMGDRLIVADQKSAFIKFIQSAKYANAR